MPGWSGTENTHTVRTKVSFLWKLEQLSTYQDWRARWLLGRHTRRRQGKVSACCCRTPASSKCAPWPVWLALLKVSLQKTGSCKALVIWLQLSSAPWPLVPSCKLVCRWLIMALRMVPTFMILEHWAIPRANSSFQQAFIRLMSLSCPLWNKGRVYLMFLHSYRSENKSSVKDLPKGLEGGDGSRPVHRQEKQPRRWLADVVDVEVLWRRQRHNKLKRGRKTSAFIKN